MGKAEIIAHQGNGLYEVELIKDTHHIQNKILVYEGQINTLTSEIIPLLEAEKTAAEGEKDEALEALNVAIENYIAGLNYAVWAVATSYNLDDIVVPTSSNGHRYICTVAGDSHATTEPTWPEETGGQVVDNTVTWEENGGDVVTKEDVVAATKLYNEKFSAYKKAVTLLDTKNLELSSLQKEKEYLQRASSVSSSITFAQCVDGQTDLTGVVGTIEIPGELNKLKIQPGFNDGAAYDASRDGILSPIMAGTPASVFYNKAILPGWQKHMPTYRTGTITSFADRFDIIDFYPDFKYFYYRGAAVQLDDIKSSAQNLGINQSSTVTAEFAPFKDFDLDFTKILWNVYFDTYPGWAHSWSNWWYWDFFYPRNIQQINLSCLNYSIGDKVVIKFEGQDWSKPKIIGFENAPPAKEDVYYVNVKLIDRGTVLTKNDIGRWYHVAPEDPLFWVDLNFWDSIPAGEEEAEWFRNRYIYDTNTNFFRFQFDETYKGVFTYNVTPPWNGESVETALHVMQLLQIPKKNDLYHFPYIVSPLFEVAYLPFFPGYYEIYNNDPSWFSISMHGNRYEKYIRFMKSQGYKLPFFGHATWFDAFESGDVFSSITLYIPYSGNIIIKDTDNIWHY